MNAAQRPVGNSAHVTVYLFNSITSIYNYIFTLFGRSHYNMYHIWWVIGIFRHSFHNFKTKQTPQRQRITIFTMQRAFNNPNHCNKYLLLRPRWGAGGADTDRCEVLRSACLLLCLSLCLFVR